MRAMRKFFVASILFGLLGACGGNALEGEMKGWKDKVCACKDKECAEKTWDEYRAWQKGKREEAKKLPEGELKKLGEIESEAKDCRRKLRDAAEGSAGAAPAAPAPAAPAATP